MIGPFFSLAFAQSPPLAFEGEAVIKVFLSPGGIIKIKAPIFYSEVKKKGDFFSAHKIEMEVSKMDSGLPLRDHKIKSILGVGQKIEAFSIEGKKGKKKNKGKFKLRLNNIEKELPLSFILLNNNTLVAYFYVNLSEFNIERPEYLGAKVKKNIKITAYLKYFVSKAPN